MTDKLYDLADDGFVTCVACGARMKADRQHCLRCFKPLHVDESALPVWRTLKISDRTGWRLAAIAGAVLIAFAALLWATRSGESDATAAHPSPAPDAPAGAAAPVAAPPPTTPAEPPSATTAAVPPATTADAPSTAEDDSAATRRAFEDKLKMDPNDPVALEGLGVILERSGETNEALTSYKRAAEALPRNATPRLRAAKLEMRLGRTQAAIADFRFAARLVPEDFSTHYDLAAALEQSGDKAAAIEEFQTARQLATDADAKRRITERLDQLGAK